jgi:hypothetical protein
MKTPANSIAGSTNSINDLVQLSVNCYSSLTVNSGNKKEHLINNKFTPRLLKM